MLTPLCTPCGRVCARACARAQQVFGAGRLVLPDLAVLKDPSFAAISVTAEQWLPVEAVTPAMMLPWWGNHGMPDACTRLHLPT